MGAENADTSRWFRLRWWLLIAVGLINLWYVLTASLVDGAGYAVLWGAAALAVALIAGVISLVKKVRGGGAAGWRFLAKAASACIGANLLLVVVARSMYEHPCTELARLDPDNQTVRLYKDMSAQAEERRGKDGAGAFIAEQFAEQAKKSCGEELARRKERAAFEEKYGPVSGSLEQRQASTVEHDPTRPNLSPEQQQVLFAIASARLKQHAQAKSEADPSWSKATFDDFSVVYATAVSTGVLAVVQASLDNRSTRWVTFKLGLDGVPVFSDNTQYQVFAPDTANDRVTELRWVLAQNASLSEP